MTDGVDRHRPLTMSATNERTSFTTAIDTEPPDSIFRRREAILKAISKLKNAPTPEDFQLSTNGTKYHPIDTLSKIVENEGTKKLIKLLKKRELRQIYRSANCGPLGGDVQIHKTAMRKAIYSKIRETSGGCERFLKQCVDLDSLQLICSKLNLSVPTRDKHQMIEEIMREINLMGMEVFHQCLQEVDPEVSALLQSTAKIVRRRSSNLEAADDANSPQQTAER
jgi:hypothetical protein